MKCPHCGYEIANGFDLVAPEHGSAGVLVELGTGKEVVRMKVVGGEAIVRESAVRSWDPGYPNVDIPTTLHQMRDYYEAKPRKRKTPRGISGAIVDWLRREQDRG